MKNKKTNEFIWPPNTCTFLELAAIFHFLRFLYRQNHCWTKETLGTMLNLAGINFPSVSNSLYKNFFKKSLTSAQIKKAVICAGVPMRTLNLAKVNLHASIVIHSEKYEMFHMNSPSRNGMKRICNYHSFTNKFWMFINSTHKNNLLYLAAAMSKIEVRIFMWLI